ncbi:sericin-2-like [Erpetoichthys calabaricus]|uniref:sericin-2-like n=1 Tax=Erpetoichthys calabaricus TaxID=27687 RepID=UPI00109F27DF|nr:sericin-2-like [Erpetoichthys calabaricus]
MDGRGASQRSSMATQHQAASTLQEKAVFIFLCTSFALSLGRQTMPQAQMNNGSSSMALEQNAGDSSLSSNMSAATNTSTAVSANQGDNTTTARPKGISTTPNASGNGVPGAVTFEKNSTLSASTTKNTEVANSEGSSSLYAKGSNQITNNMAGRKASPIYGYTVSTTQVNSTTNGSTTSGSNIGKDQSLNTFNTKNSSVTTTGSPLALRSTIGQSTGGSTSTSPGNQAVIMNAYTGRPPTMSGLRPSSSYYATSAATTSKVSSPQNIQSTTSSPATHRTTYSDNQSTSPDVNTETQTQHYNTSEGKVNSCKPLESFMILSTGSGLSWFMVWMICLLGVNSIAQS